MSVKRKRILVCIDWYEPGFKAGGPIRSVVNIVTALKEEFEFYILTSAYDLGETEPYPGIEPNIWHDQDGVFVRYMDRRALTMASVQTNIIGIQPDVLYLNSLFSRLFTIAPLILANRKGIPVVLAPRGMLGQGALDLKKGKKKVFLAAAKLFRLYRNVTWHASTREEEQEVRAVFGKKARIVVAQNIATAQRKTVDEIKAAKSKTELRFVFISRISKKKNLDLALAAISRLHVDRPVFFDVYGLIEDQEYFNDLQIGAQSREGLTIRYAGVLSPARVADVYAAASYLVLPTRHENFGHAIVEAWANGCPVIISTNTPWKGLKEKQLGWDVDTNDPGNLAAAVHEAAVLDFSSYLAMAGQCYSFFAEKMNDAEIIETNRKIFMP